jgi:hypothetical protein
MLLAISVEKFTDKFFPNNYEKSLHSPKPTNEYFFLVKIDERVAFKSHEKFRY